MKTYKCFKADIECDFLGYFKTDTIQFRLTQYVNLVNNSNTGTEKYDFVFEDYSNTNQNYYKKDSIKYYINKEKKEYQIFNSIFNYIGNHPIYKKPGNLNKADKVEIDSNENSFYIKVNQYIDTITEPNLTNAIFEYTIRKSDYFVTEYTRKFLRMGYWQYDYIKLDAEKISTKAFYKILDSVNNELIKNYTYYLPSREMVDTIPLVKAPRFNVKTLENISINNESAKLILLDFWYVGCPPCQLAMPHLEKLHQKYQNKGLLIFGVNSYDNDTVLVKNILRKQKVNYPVCMGAKELAKQYKVSAYPTFYLINNKNEIIYYQEGFGMEGMEKLDKIIAKELEK